MRRLDGRPKQRRRTKNHALNLPYGVYLRDKPKPYLVKFTRNKITINIGSYKTLPEATIYANNFLLKETL